MRYWLYRSNIEPDVGPKINQRARWMRAIRLKKRIIKQMVGTLRIAEMRTTRVRAISIANIQTEMEGPRSAQEKTGKMPEMIISEPAEDHLNHRVMRVYDGSHVPIRPTIGIKYVCGQAGQILREDAMELVV